MKKGRLIPDKEILFKDYARNWWIYDKCDYIKGKLARGHSITRAYAEDSLAKFPQYEIVKTVIYIAGNKGFHFLRVD